MRVELKRAMRRLDESPEDEYMEVMRINALRYAGRRTKRIRQLTRTSVFIAIKYASAAMSRVCPEKGKTVPGGSLMLTASGEVFDFPPMFPDGLDLDSRRTQGKCRPNRLFRLQSRRDFDGTDRRIRVDRNKCARKRNLPGPHPGECAPFLLVLMAQDGHDESTVRPG